MNEEIEAKLSMPGIALAATGALGLVFGGLSLLVFFASFVMSLLSVMGTDQMMSFLVSWAITGIPRLLFQLAGVIAPIVTIMAGLRLKAGTSPSLVLAGAILAMIPCNSCCCLGLFTGGWAIFVMRDEEVRNAMADV